MTNETQGPAPLDDITVIEIDSWMAAPSAGAILADMGANVIKIEPLRGDPLRGISRRPKVDDDDPRRTFDVAFSVDNRGKRSISVDLETTEGMALVHRLCGSANVFLCNLLSRRQAKFGLDPESMLKINPSIVHATLTGYGTVGPEAWRPGYDVTAFFGRSGIYDTMREGPEGQPPMARTAQGDHTAGLALVGAILGALRLAERTGTGQVVETSLYEAAVWTMASDICVTAIDEAEFRPRDRSHQISATGNRFPCSDGKWVVINMPLESAWPQYCKALGLTELISDERFVDMRSRFHNMPALVELLDERFRTRTRDEWGVIFDEHKIVWGPVLGLHEVVADPQAEALDMFPTVTDPDIGDYRTVAMPMKFKTAPVGPKGPMPRMGEHTRKVLAEAGYAADEIDALLDAGAVRAAD